MGAPMARNLSAAGLLESVWNRTTARADELAVELGVTAAASPAELARRCTVILTCVSADQDLESVVEQLMPGLGQGAVVVDTSTVSPLTAQQLAERLSEASVAFVDAPVSGGVEGAVRGSLSVMVGGESADIERIRPVLQAISATVTHMGPVGSGQATKAVNQVIVGGVAEAVCEALALAEKLNLPSERLLSVLGAGAAGSWFLEHRGESMLQNRFDTGFKPALLLKDLKIVRQLAQDLNIQLSVVETAIEDYEVLLGAGNEDKDISGLIRLKRSPANEQLKG
jgi:3-hydroxyisobutyrate dehydrogenase